MLFIGEGKTRPTGFCKSVLTSSHSNQVGEVELNLALTAQTEQLALPLSLVCCNHRAPRII